MRADPKIRPTTAHLHFWLHKLGLIAWERKRSNSAKHSGGEPGHALLADQAERLLRRGAGLRLHEFSEDRGVVDGQRLGKRGGASAHAPDRLRRDAQLRGLNSKSSKSSRSGGSLLTARLLRAAISRPAASPPASKPARCKCSAICLLRVESASRCSSVIPRIAKYGLRLRQRPQH